MADPDVPRMRTANANGTRATRIPGFVPICAAREMPMAIARGHLAHGDDLPRRFEWPAWLLRGKRGRWEHPGAALVCASAMAHAGLGD